MDNQARHEPGVAGRSYGQMVVAPLYLEEQEGCIAASVHWPIKGRGCAGVTGVLVHHEPHV